MNDENLQPIAVEMPGDEDARREQMRELLPYLLDATENYPEPYYLLEYNREDIPSRVASAGKDARMAGASADGAVR